MYQNNIFQFWKLQYDSGFIKGISDNIFIFNSSWRQKFHLTFASAVQRSAVQCSVLGISSEAGKQPSTSGVSSLLENMLMPDCGAVVATGYYFS